MKIKTCYVVKLQKQLVATKLDKKTKQTDIDQSRISAKNLEQFCQAADKQRVDSVIMQKTAEICLEALKFCMDIFLKEWKFLSSYKFNERKREADCMIHSTEDIRAKYPEFDKKFPNIPSYMRRAIIADALGNVSSHVSSHENWENKSAKERGEEPVLGYPKAYELTFYKQERNLAFLNKGLIQVKLYNGKTWGWYCFQISMADARYLGKLCSSRVMLSPVIEKKNKSYYIRFCFEEEKELVSSENPLGYRVLGVDLGINAAASWCVMESDGTVHSKGVIHLGREEDCLRHVTNRKRMYQQAGKKSKNIYRRVRHANERMSINTAKAIIDIAVLYNVDCIVFEHLGTKGKVKGKSYRERIHLWRANDTQDRVVLHAHRHGMRISRICPWGTSKYAYDGSGETDRQSVKKTVKGKEVVNYSLCTFESGKVYNCDLSAAQNIAARYFLREYAKCDETLKLPCTPQRTLNTLIQLMAAQAAA